MSQQRKRHLKRQPTEESVRLAMAGFLDGAAEVDVERHSYDWRSDDLMVWVRLRQPLTGSALALFRREVTKRMHSLLPAGQPLGDWLVVVECKGDELATVAWDENLEEPRNEASET